MSKILKPISVFVITIALIISTQLRAGGNSPDRNPNSYSYAYDSTVVESILELNIAEKVYDSLELDVLGLSKEALEFAFKGYQNLLNSGAIKTPDIITICDFSQSSRNKRLYVIDFKNYEVLLNTYVAHGKNSGADFAQKFSNKPQSHQSSLGFYVTDGTYRGEHGLSLRINGVDKGFNDRAYDRAIVVHGSDYIGENRLNNGSSMGRSYGCPAVPQKEIKKLINTIKDGTCLFIYHPSEKYLSGSKILNV